MRHGRLIEHTLKISLTVGMNTGMENGSLVTMGVLQVFSLRTVIANTVQTVPQLRYDLK